MKSIILSGWPKGMDNIHEDHELKGDTLRRAVNLDVLDTGKLRRRRGSTLSLAAAGAHSLWSDPAGNAYFLVGSTLKRFNRDGTATSLGTVTSTERLSYASVNGVTYFMSPTARGRVVDGVLNDWGVDVPVTPPSMMPDSGVLPAGTYYACMTNVLLDGRESGASLLSTLTLSDTGGVSFYGLSVPAQAGVVSKRIYLTTADGEVLYRVAEVDAADTVAVCGTYGAELRTANLVPPPKGTCIAQTLGRIFIADGKTVWFTEALDYDHVDLRKGFYQFPADVTLIAPADDGIYVCADQTYWIAGAGTAEAQPKLVFEFGAVAGTLASIPSSGDAIWFTERGAVIGGDGGGAELVSIIDRQGGNEQKVAPGQMASAAAMYREQESSRQFVVVGDGGLSSSLQCGSYAEAEIIRRSAQ